MNSDVIIIVEEGVVRGFKTSPQPLSKASLAGRTGRGAFKIEALNHFIEAGSNNFVDEIVKGEMCRSKLCGVCFYLGRLN